MNRSTYAALVAALISTASVVVRAEPAPSHSLEWNAAEACPSREAFEKAIHERLGAAPFAPGAARTLTVELSRDADEWRGTLRVSEGETVVGSQTLESSSPDCAALFSAVVAVATVMLERLADPAAAPPAEVELAETPAQPPPAPVPAPARPLAEPEPEDSEMLFVGIELVQDLVLFQGGEACTPDEDRFDCYLEGTETPFEAGAGEGGKTASGLLPGAQRLLATLTWELGGRAALDARVGAAFGNVGPDFVPWHLEVGARYFLAEPSAPLRGFVGASLGYAFVDSKLRVDVLDDPALPRRLDAVERLGPGFVSARLGFRWVFARPHSVGAALALGVTFPESGFVLGPSIGYAIGF